MTFRTRSNLPGPSDSTRSEGAMATSAQSSRPSSAWRTTLVSKKAFIPMLLFRVPQVALLSVDQGSPSLALSDLLRCLVIGPYLWPGERVLLRPSKKSATMLDAEMPCSLAKRLVFSIKALSMRNLSCSRFISLVSATYNLNRIVRQEVPDSRKGGYGQALPQRVELAPFGSVADQLSFLLIGVVGEVGGKPPLGFF